MRLAPASALALSLGLSLLGGPAAATPEYVLPTLFDVTGVAAGDKLNIRETPSAQARIIGTLPADAKGVEVVAERAGWAQVNTAERAGWVKSRYLAYRTDVWLPGGLPAGLNCLGTEPFWSVRQVGPQVVYETPDGARAMERRVVLDDGLPRSPARAVIAGDGQGRMTAVIQPAQCSDGMSDRVYGLSAVLVFDGAGQPSRMQTGCCRLAP